MQIINKNINELIPYINNPRKNDRAVDYVASSIKNFGFKVPIIIDAQNEIVAGHTRLKAAIKLNYKEVPCIVADDLTPAQIKAYRIADNKVSELAEWDIDLLKIELQDLDEFTGFELEELDMIFQEEKEIIEDEVPEIQEEAITKLGDLYEIGEHRLLCGDSTDGEQVAKLMNGKKASLCFTSPPYNAGKSELLSGNTHMTDNKYNEYNDNKTQNDFFNFLKLFTDNILNHCNYLICNLQSLAGNKIALIDYLYEYKNNFIDYAIWDKGHGAPAMAKNVMNSCWEFLFFISSKKNATRAIPNANFRGTISNIHREKPQRNNEYSEIHAATFPLHLPKFAIQFTKKNDILLDCFIGTGSTMVACHQLNRKCYGMELDPKYCDVIIRRMINLDSNITIKRNGLNCKQEFIK
jgi:site-specific DNA-methyltransferase (adenine-specific)